MFNGKALFMLTIAIIFGGGAAIFANNWLQQQAGNTVVTAETTPILVAARDIQFGQSVEETHVKVVHWPTENLPENVITDMELVIGKVANQKIVPGEPLLEGRIVEKLAGSKLSALIAPDKRAITVRVNDVAGVAGFLLPGNRVDVLGTRMVNKRAVTKPVLQNVKVLAIDQRSGRDKDEPVVVRAVTLEADLDESMILVRATSEGTVQLVLRNPEDLATRIAKKPIAKVAQVRKKAPTVKIIRGTSVNNSTVRN